MQSRYPDPMKLIAHLILLATTLSLLVLAGCSGRFGDMPALAEIENVDVMKQTFYDYLQPVVDYQNGRILEQRAELAAIRDRLTDGEEPGWMERRTLRSLAQEYEVEWDRDALATVADTLWRRVDVIPADLALVQAAKESGWGRSRFAVEHNNLFGQWCYDPGCGVVPERRSASATHEVAAFDSVSESVRRYMNNLNTHKRYAPLRRLRLERRRNDQVVTGAALASGLLGYSERGRAYVEEVLSMMRQNSDMLDEVASS